MDASVITKRGAGRLSALLARLDPRPASPRAAVLTYHRTAPALARPVDGVLNVPPDTMRDQLGGLAALGWRFVPLGELVERFDTGGDLPHRAVAVTFDDGYHCNRRFALPVLEELGVPATFFVTTGHLDSTDPFPFDPSRNDYRHEHTPAEHYRPFTADDLDHLATHPLVELGGHTHTHADFRHRPAELADDLARCLATLRRHAEQDGFPFAFPFGVVHAGFAAPDMIEVVEAAGFTTALTTTAEPLRPGQGPYGWGRVNAYAWDDAAVLSAKLDGHYAWVPRAQTAGARARTTTRRITDRRHHGPQA